MVWRINWVWWNGYFIFHVYDDSKQETSIIHTEQIKTLFHCYSINTRQSFFSILSERLKIVQNCVQYILIHLTWRWLYTNLNTPIPRPHDVYPIEIVWSRLNWMGLKKQPNLQTIWWSSSDWINLLDCICLLCGCNFEIGGHLDLLMSGLWDYKWMYNLLSWGAFGKWNFFIQLA